MKGKETIVSITVATNVTTDTTGMDGLTEKMAAIQVAMRYGLGNLIAQGEYNLVSVRVDSVAGSMETDTDDDEGGRLTMADKVNDDRIRQALSKALDKAGVAGGVPDTLLRPSQRRTAVVGGTVAAPAGRQARRSQPPAVVRGFSAEVGRRVMDWDWIENRRGGSEAGDRAEEKAREGGALLAFHMAGMLANRRING